MVYVIDDNNVANPRQIQIAMGLSNNYLIESGIEAGERIMVEGLLRTRPGEQVRIIEPTEDADNNKTQATGSS
jgi:membrane fusion protein (multidrug efflux system)